MLALGILAALIERGHSGRGQVIDAAMVEGSALLATCFFGYLQTGTWSERRGTNIVDSGAPFYDAYETADGRWLTVAAMEPHFYRDLLALLGLSDEPLPDQHDQTRWPEMKQRFAEIIHTRTRDDWITAAGPYDACVAAVLDVDEIEHDPHLTARESFVRRDGLLQPAPAPRFSRTPARLGHQPPLPGEHTREGLADWGLSSERIDALLGSGAIGRAAMEPAT
jgi:alpha-methylacyl-CoA racemase